MLFAASWMDLENIILSKVSQDRETQILYDMWNLKKIQMNPHKTLTDSQT